METVSYKCINCVAPLIYNADSHKFTCEFCRSEFTEEELRAHWGDIDQSLDNEAQPETAAPDPEDFQANTAMYFCENCGAEIITDKSTAASFCLYCHSPVVISNRLTGNRKPDMVIPFLISEEAAKQRFFEFCGKKHFLPKNFLSDAHLDMMKGVYFPYWMINSLKDGGITARAKKVRRWIRDDYEYTETKIYKIQRSGKIDFKNFPHSAFKNQDRNILKYVNPYDDKDLKKFSMAYLSGFFAEKRDTERQELQAEVDRELEEYAQKIYENTIDPSYDSVSVESLKLHTINESWKYAMLPVWLMTFKYKNKNYIYAMNGQTGKNYGELPCSKSKLALLAAAIFVVLSVLGILGGYYLL